MPNAEASSFRYNARKVFLTYPRCDIPMPEMLEALTAIKAYKHYVIGQEHHEDEGLHLHVVLSYPTPVNTRNERFWDIRGFHPNIQKPQNIENCIGYCKKEGNFLTNWPETKEWGDILTEATTSEEFFSLVRANQPKEYVINHERLEYFADKHFQRPTSPFNPPFQMEEWTLPESITNWLSTEFTKTGI